MLELDKIYNMDCIDGMKQIDDNSIDLILCDLPYGTTQCSWDSIIPLDTLWTQYKRITKDHSAIVLTATQPFTTTLISSNIKLYKQSLVWLKTRPSNVFNAKKMFMKWHEDILIFYKKLPTFNPQMRKGEPYIKKHYLQEREKGIYHKTGERDEHITKNEGNYYPKTVIEISNDNHKSLHPTQKPLKLFEYLIKTYSNENDVILDNCMGSGTTAVSCKELNRHFIGFEINKEYYDISLKRLKNVPRRLETFLNKKNEN